MNGSRFSTGQPDPGAGRRGLVAAGVLCVAVFVVFFALGRAVRPAGTLREATGPSVAASTNPSAIPPRLGNAPAIEILSSAPPRRSPAPSTTAGSAQSPSRAKAPAPASVPAVAAAPAGATTPTSSRQQDVTSTRPASASVPAATQTSSSQPEGQHHAGTSVIYESSG
jgi:hypothetical protein